MIAILDLLSERTLYRTETVRIPTTETVVPPKHTSGNRANKQLDLPKEGIQKTPKPS